MGAVLSDHLSEGFAGMACSTTKKSNSVAG